jgi:hypothetical protein
MHAASRAPETTLPDRRDVLIVVGICLAAAAFFRVTLHATLELSDEGMIIYPSWLVARGAVPYRDFMHLYGPSVFFLNGALFARFGADLASVRWPLLLCKVALTGCVYLLSRHVASRFAAVVVTVVMVAIWGTPIWTFNVPYANHYALPLSMLALLMICILPRWPLTRLVLAGLAIGLAATFKQTLGVFAAVAVATWIVGSVRRRTPVTTPAEPSSLAVRRGGTVLACAFLLFAIGMYVVYVRAHLLSLSTLCLLAPALGGAMASAGNALLGGNDTRIHLRNGQWMLAFGIGFAIPAIACLAFFAGHGLLGAFVFNTVSGVPQQMQWFDALPIPPWRSVLLAVAIGASLLGIRVRRSAGSGRLRATLVTLSAMTAPVSIAMLAWGPATTGVREYFTGEWTRDMAYVVWFLPLLLAALSFVPIFGSRQDNDSTLRLLWLFTAAAILQLYPAADLAHVAMVLPGCLPLLAFGIDRARRDPAGHVMGAVTVVTVLVAVGVVAPCIRMVQIYRESRPRAFVALERAPDTWAIGSRFTDAVALTDKLRSVPPAGDGGLFVLANEQLLYFLAGIDSPFPHEEFVMYLVETGLISAEEAQALVDERRVIDRLETVRPLIVDHAVSPAGGRFRQAFPRVGAYLAQRYREVDRVGDYILWRWTPSPGDEENSAETSTDIDAIVHRG